MKARIVRVDERNFAVQSYRTIENPKTKEKRQEWVDEGYFGHRLDHAAEFALARGFNIGEAITPKSIRDAVREIVKGAKEALSS